MNKGENVEQEKQDSAHESVKYYDDPKQVVVEKSPRQQAYYLKGVNMNYSFASLERIAMELGADLSRGDVLVVDNIKGNKRKAFKKTENGSIILYVTTGDNCIFEELGESGTIVRRKRPPLDYIFK